MKINLKILYYFNLIFNLLIYFYYKFKSFIIYDN